jgi:carbamoyl-phosphate synthase large subunit
VFLSLADGDKPAGLVVAKRLRELGMGIVATEGTARYLANFDLPVDSVVAKVHELRDDADAAPAADDTPETAVDLISSGKVTLVVNTPQGRGGRTDGEQIRKASVLHGVACVTTISAALVVVQGLTEQRGHPLNVRSLQELHAG